MFCDGVPSLHAARKCALSAFPTHLGPRLNRRFAPATRRVPLPDSIANVCRTPASSSVRRSDFTKQRVRNEPVVTARFCLANAVSQGKRCRTASGTIGREPRHLCDSTLLLKHSGDGTTHDRSTNQAILDKHTDCKQATDRRLVVRMPTIDRRDCGFQRDDSTRELRCRRHGAPYYGSVGLAEHVACIDATHGT